MPSWSFARTLQQSMPLTRMRFCSGTGVALTFLIRHCKSLTKSTGVSPAGIAAVQENCSFNRTGVPSIRSGVRTQSHKYAVE